MQDEKQETDEVLSAEELQKQAQAIWDDLDSDEGGEESQPPERNEPEPKPVEPVKEEPQAGFSEEDRALLRQVPELMNLVKATVGRVGSLQSELAKIGHAAAKGAGEQPTERQIDKASADPEKWAALKKDFPDWAEGVEAFVSTRIPNTPQINLDEEVGRRINERLTPIEQARREDAIEVVASIEPEWKKIADSQEFAAWLAKKPADYQKVAAETWKPSQVLRILHDFRSDSSEQKPHSKANLKTAAIPRGTQKANLTKPESEMTPDELWAYLDSKEGVAPRRR